MLDEVQRDNNNWFCDKIEVVLTHNIGEILTWYKSDSLLYHLKSGLCFKKTVYNAEW